jgi:cell division protein FtsL
LVIAEQIHLPIEGDLKPKSAARANVAVKKCTLLTLAIIAGLALCMLYISQVANLVALGYQVETMQNSISELQTENNQLELNATELQTPARIAQIATTKLGMQEPQDIIVASFTPVQVSDQEPQAKSPSPANSWGTRLLAAIPGFVGRAEASPSTQ